MKKLKLSLLTAFVLGSILINSNSQAQNSPCGWTMLRQLTYPKCYGVCDGKINVTPNYSLPNGTYLWNTGSTSSIITGLCPGTYTVTLTDAEGCSQAFSYDLLGPDPLVVSCTTTVNESAPGAADGVIEASVSGGWGGPYNFVWQTIPVQYGTTLSNLTAGSYTVRVYDEKECYSTATCEIITDKKEECEGFKTLTQGAWGQCQQNGNNPGTYLFANFDAAYPNDLIIGCTRKLKLTSAQAVCDFLPSGTQPRALNAGTMVDPGGAYRNVFAGQLVAATLNVGFDLYDSNFGVSNLNLGGLIIKNGPLAGLTVNQLLVESNKKIGGCASSYSASDLSDALDSFNKNYDNGTVDKGFLVCDEANAQRTGNTLNELNINVYPNPVNGVSNVNIIVANDESLQVDLYNVTGQKVAELYKGEVKAGDEMNMVLNGTSLESGIYFVKVVSNNKVITHKLIVKN